MGIKQEEFCRVNSLLKEHRALHRQKKKLKSFIENAQNEIKEIELEEDPKIVVLELSIANAAWYFSSEITDEYYVEMITSLKNILSKMEQRQAEIKKEVVKSIPDWNPGYGVI